MSLTIFYRIFFVFDKGGVWKTSVKNLFKKMETMTSKNAVFFGENGRTSTSANYLANKAKEAYEEIEQRSRRLSFYNEYRQMFNGGERLLVKNGIDLEKVKVLVADFEKMGRYKALIAWLREAIKARKEQENIINSYSFEKWLKYNGIDLHFDAIEPELQPSITVEDAVGELTIKERYLYYSLEANVSNLGLFIHPKGSFSHARKDLAEKINNPIDTVQMGDAVFVVSYAPIVDMKDVDDLFMTLQETHRDMQAQLNGIKHKIEMRVESDRSTKLAKYNSEIEKYNAEYHAFEKRIIELKSKFDEWKLKELDELRSLKIVIPDKLSDVVGEIESMGR